MVQGVEESNQCTPSSLEKLQLSFDIKLEWETKQQMPSNSDFERNIYFAHPHFIVVNPLGEVETYKEDLVAYKLLSVYCCKEKVHQ